MNLSGVTRIGAHKLHSKLGVPVQFIYFDTHDGTMVYNASMEFYGAYHSWDSFEKYYRRDDERLNMSAGQSNNMESAGNST